MEVNNIELHLVSPIPPSSNHYLGYRSVKKGDGYIATSYTTSKAKTYKSEFTEYVKEEVSKQGWNLEPNKYQHFYVDTWFYFDRIDKDCSNHFKVMLDAITDTQLIWLDDNVALERVQRIYYDSKDPRIEICIRPVDYIGVFDNASQLEEFVSNCVECTRYERNCSILRNAKIGRIQEEIKGGKCLKQKNKRRAS